jgi:BMFP domain-containing protein YqiC
MEDRVGSFFEISMHSRNPLLDEFAKLTTNAVGLAQAAGEEAKAAFRAQADRFAAELDLIRRDEFEALRAEIASLRAELTALKAGAGGGQTPPKEDAC